MSDKSRGNQKGQGESEPSETLLVRQLPASTEDIYRVEEHYFEIVYAPILGPTAVLLARTMARHLRVSGGLATVDPVELALEIGVRASKTNPLGRKSHLARALNRLAHDRIVTRLDPRVLGVRMAVPAVGEPILSKLPATARVAHSQLVAGSADAPTEMQQGPIEDGR